MSEKPQKPSELLARISPYHPTVVHGSTKLSERGDAPVGFALMFWTLGFSTLAFLCWGAYQARIASQENSLRWTALSHKFTTDTENEQELAPAPAAEPAQLLVSENVTAEPPVLLPAIETAAPPTGVELLEVEPTKIELPAVPAVAPLPVVFPQAETPTAQPSKVPPPVIEPPVVEIPRLPEPPQLSPPPVIPVVAMPPMILDVEDATPLVFLPTQTGETPMLNNWKTLAFCSIFTASAVAAPPVLAGEKDNKEVLERLDKMEKALKQDFKAVQGEMESIRGDLKKIKEEELLDQRLKLASSSVKLADLEKTVAKLQSDLELLRKRIPTEFPVGPDRATIEDVKAKLGAIEQAILKLAPTEKRLALSSPTQIGRVLLVNLYAEELLFVVNQKPYRVAPNTTVALDNIPAGQLGYEVLSATWGQRAKSTTALAANETFTLTAR